MNDCTAPSMSWYDGKVMLVGEAYSVVRPHFGTGFDTTAMAALEFASNKNWEKNN